MKYSNWFSATEHIWHADFNETDGTVDVVINSLLFSIDFAVQKQHSHKSARPLSRD